MKLLWLLWLFVVLPAVFLYLQISGQAGFGRSYLKNSRLCHQWTCINTKLGFPDSLPLKEESAAALRRVLPEGPWQDVVDKVLDNCYGNRTRRFTNTCPGQALMHCVVDQMINFCPESSLRKDDACSPVSSLAGLKYMFSQSRYDDLEKNLPKEHRPSWFLKNYFDSKCCDLPVIFNTTVLEECGFTSFMNYVDHGPSSQGVQVVHFQASTSTPAPTLPAPTTEAIYERKATIASWTHKPIHDELFSLELTSPLDCCEMTKFIDSSAQAECGFQLNWAGQERLVISSTSPVTEAPTSTTTEKTDTVKDIMLVPHSCEKETCVFQKQGIIGDSGEFDIDAYMKMLHNFTDAHPAWTKAQARVLTKCLVKPVDRNYGADCEINNVLACTFDVLTENCPYKRKSNVCKHGSHDTGCQISSSKYRPKNRREICLLPELIHHDHLSECGLQSLYRVEHVPAPPKIRKQGWSASKFTCTESKAPTTCMMNKMGILNKYNFMDYFKMKDRIRQFTQQTEWAALQEIYMSAFINTPMYQGHCNSERKLLNVVDAMLMTCPLSKRKDTPQCTKLFSDMKNTAPVDKQNVTQEKMDEIMKHYHHVFMPPQPTAKPNLVIRKKHEKTLKTPVFEYGLLNSKEAPPVKVISVKPETTVKRPLILQPVYLRPNYGHVPMFVPQYVRQGTSVQRPNVSQVPVYEPVAPVLYPRPITSQIVYQSPLSQFPVRDGVFRGSPFWLHEQIAKAHLSTSTPSPDFSVTIPQGYETTPEPIATTLPPKIERKLPIGMLPHN
ncbi:hypothetical protein B5X24_HaOG201693 [Helicoverpa armigera]|nr:hypothetical protein B5X24_HaOG201693 [Helicoverpa armigera]